MWAISSSQTTPKAATRLEYKVHSKRDAAFCQRTWYNRNFEVIGYMRVAKLYQTRKAASGENTLHR